MGPGGGGESLIRSAAFAVCLAAIAACGEGPAVVSEAPMGAEEAFQGRAAADSLVAEGERVYLEYCAGCHGEAGDGLGPASRFLDPKPRDFTKGLFKFAGVASGELPRDEDLLRTLERGLPGSSMPSWTLLPQGQRRAVVAYIKTFSEAWRERAAGTPVAISEDPYAGRGTAAARRAIERGEVVYHVIATCWQCHPAYASAEEVARMAAREGREVVLRRGAERPEPVDDSWGGRILPTDFPVMRLKSGSAPADLYRTIASGVGGTAMPTWKGGLPDEDLWALAYYVKSLADRRWARPRAVPSLQPESLLGAARGAQP